MTTTRSTKTTETPLARDLFYAARYYLGGRRGLIIFAGLALIAGLAMNWSWLVAAGIAPILISALPCAAMCALGLCMNRAGGKSCAKTGSEHRPPATTSTDAMSSAQVATFDTPPPPSPGELATDEGCAPSTSPKPQASTERNMPDA
jgi:hypothetical protein